VEERETCIAGVGESRYARWGKITDSSELGLACDAVLAALADAGMPPAEVDGFASYSNDANLPAQMQLALGCRALRHASLVWGGGGGGALAAVGNAAAAVASGQAECVVVFRSLCQGQSGRLGSGRSRGPLANFTLPFGLVAPVQQAALVASRHRHERGGSAEALAEIACAFRAHAQANPRAIMRGRPMEPDDYFASPMISDPLRLLDCCLESDAAAAVVVTTREHARRAGAAAAPILAVGTGGGRHWGLGFLGAHNPPLERAAGGNAEDLGRELFARAGLRPEDVKVAQFYDAFTPMVLQALEDYGFCAPGEADAFVRAGSLRLGGRLPSNTAGGSLSEAYVHGCNLVVEAVRQMRGTAINQVPGADVAFVGGGPGVAPTSALLLGKNT